MFQKRPARLDHRLRFPSPERAATEGPWKGLVAVGGDLSVERLLLAYRSGIFPWTVDPVTWWSPDPRGVLEFDELHLPGSLERELKRNPFRMTTNRCFREVISGCARPAPGREHTWISPEFIEAYTELHHQGHAHSLECWREEQLAGGIYGVAVGGVFVGESMFHRVSNASKAALVHLVSHLRERGFRFLDIQVTTPTTRQMGGKEIARSEYLARLRDAVNLPVRF